VVLFLFVIIELFSLALTVETQYMIPCHQSWSSFHRILVEVLFLRHSHTEEWNHLSITTNNSSFWQWHNTIHPKYSGNINSNLWYFSQCTLTLSLWYTVRATNRLELDLSVCLKTHFSKSWSWIGMLKEFELSNFGFKIWMRIQFAYTQYSNLRLLSCYY